MTNDMLLAPSWRNIKTMLIDLVNQITTNQAYSLNKNNLETKQTWKKQSMVSELHWHPDYWEISQTFWFSPSQPCVVQCLCLWPLGPCWSGASLVMIWWWSGASLVLVWWWSGASLVMIWCWSGAGLVLVWCWSGADLVLVWCWSGADLVLVWC